MVRLLGFALVMGAACTALAQAPAQSPPPAAPATAAPAEPEAAPVATPAPPSAEAAPALPPATADQQPSAQPPAAAAPVPAAVPPAVAASAVAAPAQPVVPAQSTLPPAYAHRYMLEAELRDLTLKRSELGLGGPIALIISGGVVLLLSGTLLLIAMAADSYCDVDGYAYDYDYDYGGDCIDDGDTDTLYIVGGFGALLGGLTALYGIIRLIDRAGERRALGLRMKEIRRELQTGYSFGLRLGLGPERAGASLRVSF